MTILYWNFAVYGFTKRIDKSQINTSPTDFLNQTSQMEWILDGFIQNHRNIAVELFRQSCHPTITIIVAHSFELVDGMLDIGIRMFEEANLGMWTDGCWHSWIRNSGRALLFQELWIETTVVGWWSWLMEWSRRLNCGLVHLLDHLNHGIVLETLDFFFPFLLLLEFSGSFEAITLF